jgi:UDP-4-amino-4,6-dideoxy-N-acetyl-beta-L-altrosamine transaminase
MIPYGRQNINDDDIQSIVDVLKSDFLTQGPVLPKFEKKICEYTGAKFAIAINSGTSALHLACLSLGLTEGDILWTSPITFVASANCARYCGASVNFIDIDPITWNISIECLREKLEDAEKIGVLPKILVVVHLGGLPCFMEEIFELSIKYNFYIIEDACHAIGGKYQNEVIGSCRYSHITVFSFHPVKTITTGEGGMALTNSSSIAEKIKLLRSHGITRDAKLMTRVPDGPWYYQQIELGYNYRMTDIQAALGVSQLERLDEFVTLRHEIALKYYEMLAGLPIQLPYFDKTLYSGLHLFVIRLNLKEIKKTHLEVFNFLRVNNIGVNIHYIPVHLQPYYQKFGFSYGDFPEAESYYSEAISIPIFPNLSNIEVDNVVSTITNSLL